MRRGGKRAVAVWHRRSGKDNTALNRTAVEMSKLVGMYWHMLPKQAQARRSIWDGIDNNGVRFIDQAFPRELRRSTHKQEMKIEWFNGSIWQLCGSDNYNNLVGGNPRGVVYSEWSLSKPAAWDFLRPILLENKGWAMFLYTPRGKNHGYTSLEIAKKNLKWFNETLTVDDTGGVITPEDIQEERDSGMSDEMIEQEYYCSFHAALPGSYYGTWIADAEKEGRVCSVPYDPAVAVHTAWDIGVDDECAIWFFQVIPGGEIHVIDYLQDTDKGLDYYLSQLNQRNYAYGFDYVPHDFKSRSFAANAKSCAKIARAHGRKLKIQKKMQRIGRDFDRIQASRMILPRCWFDAIKCEQGLDALRSYRRQWDQEKRTHRNHPEHDWASHGADAFGQFAVGYRTQPIGKKPGSGRIGTGQPSSGWMRG